MLPQYFEFCRKYYKHDGLPHQYAVRGIPRLRKDQNSLLSYSWDGNMMTIDPVSTANPGWQQFLTAYNEFCSEHGGMPLLNQTPRLHARAGAKGAGRPLDSSSRRRGKTYDPDNRLLNAYFRDCW